MTGRRRLAAALVAVAAVLLIGRLSALAYADHAWYESLGAVSLWRERTRDVFAIHLVSATFAGLFALLNLSAIRRSIISLAFPRRLGNVEFGEEVPRRILDRAAYVLACVVAGVMSLAAPSWERMAMVGLGTRFGETDPFFQMDLGFYTAWLPLESAIYVWCLTLLIIVAATVVSLYALTPSLRWHRGSFHVSVRVRRHLTALAALFLLTMSWSYRLDGYELLIYGSGNDGMFSYVDHQWLIPAYLSLSVGTVAAAALVLVSGWTGQMRAGFFTISAVLIFSIALDLILPSVVRQLGNSTVSPAWQAPYVATRAAFTARAYGLTRGDTKSAPHEERRFESFIDSGRVAKVMSAAKDSALIYPGATGAALVKGRQNVAAPLLGRGLRRLALAWSEQRLDLAWTATGEGTRISRNRDVRSRVHDLMPVFSQGSHVVPAYVGDTLVWVLELYSASSTYPLSRHFILADSDRSYFRHSGTAIVNSATGRVTIVPSQTPDAIAVAWRVRYPANIRAGGPDLLDELASSPGGGAPVALPATSTVTDAVFRAEVVRLYTSMRNALSSGDLKGFAAAYDSLGTAVRR